jgi:hypothetical protein
MREVSAVLRDLGRATEQTPKDKKLTLFKELFGLWAIAGGAKLTVAQFDYLIEEIDKAGGAAKRTAQEMDTDIGLLKRYKNHGRFTVSVYFIFYHKEHRAGIF